MRDKNHEGYSDPTACEALRRARKTRKKQGREFHLYYILQEIEGFQKLMEGGKRYE